MKHKCHMCGNCEDENLGSWEQSPYLFFCGHDCHDQWHRKNGICFEDDLQMQYTSKETWKQIGYSTPGYYFWNKDRSHCYGPYNTAQQLINAKEKHGQTN